MVHSPQLIRATMALGGAGLVNVSRNSKRLRIPRVMLVGIVAYLESRRNCDGSAFTLPAQCVPFPGQVTSEMQGQLYRLLGRMALNPGRVRALQGENGAAFHLAVLAYHQLQHELNRTNPRPIDMEAYRRLELTLPNGQSSQFDRSVDLVLADRAEDLADEPDYSTGQRESGHTRIELKSYLGTSLGSVTRWKVHGGKDRTSPHREFSLDCAAQTLEPSLKIVWMLQKFAARNGVGAGPSKPQADRWFKQLRQVPINAVPAEFGASSSSDDICPDVDELRFDVVGDMLKGSLRSALFSGLSTAFIDSVVDKYADDRP